MPWEEFRRYAQINTISSDRNRATGRTTKMLVEAIFASQTDDVELVGWNNSYSDDLVYQARVMSAELGLEPLKVNAGSGRGSLGRQVFVDHYDSDNRKYA
jgi:hypothetical protein